MQEINKEIIKYTPPVSKTEAIELLRGLPIELYSRMKGRGLGIYEKVLDGEDNRVKLQTARDNYILLLSSISNSIQRKIEDCISVLKEDLL